MTKKHFIRFAAILKRDLDDTKARWPDTLPEMTKHALYAAQTFGQVARDENPKFDYDRFMAACGLR